jgi:isochorismate pyruvate lyase
MAKKKAKTKAKRAKAKAKPAAKTAKSKSRKAASAKPKAKKAKGKAKASARVSKEPAWRRIACTSLADIRANIDRLDATIVPLLCERLHFVTQAANFKPSVAGVVVPSRVEEIIASVRAQAAQLGARPETIEAVYRNLIDAFTADEQRHWAALHTQTRLSDKW